MRSAAVVAVIAILVVASLGAGYLAGSGIRQTETQTVTSTTTIAKTISTSSVTSSYFSSSSFSSSSSSFSSVRAGQPIQATNVMAANITLENMDGGGHVSVFDPNASRIYALGVPLWVDDSRDYSLAVVDTSSNAVIANVSLPNTGGLASCYNLAVDDSTGMVYIIAVGDSNNGLFGKLVTFSASTDAVTAEVTLNFTFVSSGIRCDPRNAQFDPSTHLMWAQWGIGVAAINVLTGSVDESVRLSFVPDQVAVDPHTRMVYALGCVGATNDLCGSQQFAIINGTGVATVSLNSSAYGTMALDPSTDVVYVSGGSQLVALNATDGRVIFKANSETCGQTAIAVIPSPDQVVMLSNPPTTCWSMTGRLALW